MDNLYKVQEEDLEKLKRILTVVYVPNPYSFESFGM